MKDSNLVVAGYRSVLRVVMVTALTCVVLAAGWARAEVLVNEISYNPGSPTLEFLELYNSGPEDVPLAGWTFVSGIGYVFPAGANLPAGGYVLVAKDRDRLLEHFAGLSAGAVFGNYEGGLANSGERIALENRDGAIVEDLRYGDNAPWDAAADGDGASLQRICAAGRGSNPQNWRGSAAPTPLAANALVECPAPQPAPPRIAINEIHYHPLADQDEIEEFVELYNTTAESINLQGYRFSAGIEFTFADELILPPGGFVVVCRNREYMELEYGVENAVGDFEEETELSNAGERITLVDDMDRLVDSVRYADEGGWPVAADGMARSLERIVPTAPSDDPASWKEASFGDPTVWQSVVTQADHTSRSSRVSIYLGDEGEMLIDNLLLEDVANPGVNLLPNGDFNSAIEPWELRGNHETSFIEESAGMDGSPALHVVSTGRGSATSQGVNFELEPPLERNGPIYRLTFDYRYLSGTQELTVKLSGGGPTRGLYWEWGRGSALSPGQPNSVLREQRPPFVERLRRFPQEPSSSDLTFITARVRADAEIDQVFLVYNDGTEIEPQIVMFDDGEHGDGAAGDGVYGTAIPAQAHNTVVAFRIYAEDVLGVQTVSPPATDPTGYHAYYVNDYRPPSELPAYTLIIPNPQGRPVKSLVSSYLNGPCNSAGYRKVSFAYRGDVYYDMDARRRGGSVCGSATKPYLKVRFNHGRFFDGLRKLNLQSLWTDKSLVRERLAWDAFDEFGSPTCFEYYIRLHVNGEYYGLYAALEHPDQRYLERNNLDGSGNLYKATASREERNGTYEKKTNENGDMTDLREFLNAMHDTPTNELVDFFSTRLDEDRMIDYQMVQTLTNNADYPHKNHYLYHEPGSDRWMTLAWDMDLVFGKRWDGNYSGVYHDRMDTPGNNPWYTTSVDGGGGNELLDRFFSRAGTWYRRSYLVRLWDALQERYTVDFYEQRIDAHRQIINVEQMEDIEFWGRTPPSGDDRNAPAEFEPNIDRVMDHITRRREYLINYVETRAFRNLRVEEGVIPELVLDHDRVRITEVMYNPVGSDDFEFIELWNPMARAIDLSGWSIEGLGFTFPDDARAGADEVFLVAKDPASIRRAYPETASLQVFGPYDGQLDNDGEILRVKDAGYDDYPATIDFLRYGIAGEWPSAADGLGHSIEWTDPGDFKDNDFGGFWRASAALGGSPGTLSAPAPQSFFTRGDANADGRADLSDSITILAFLFRGSASVTCRAALDVDGSGAIDPTDAIFLLGYQFGMHDEPIPAPGPGECGPVDAVECEVSVCSP